MDAALSPARPGIEHRLSRMVQQPTVDRRGDASFVSFEAVLLEDFPLIHSRLSRTVIVEGGLLYHWQGRSSVRPVVLMAHFDVVPADDPQHWSHDPFSGDVIDGAVHGRGTLDDKGPMIAVLEAVENLLADGYLPEQDIYLSFGANEETYGRGAQAAADLLRGRGITPWLVIDEGGAVVDAPLSFAPVQSAMIGVSEKGVVTVELSVRSDGGHASAPASVTSAGRLAGAITRLEQKQFPAHMSKPIREMLSAFRPHVAFRHRVLLSLLTGFPSLGARLLAARGGEPAALLRTTVVATMLDGGSAPNVLPPRLSATLNIRVAQTETVARVLERLKAVIDDDSVAIELLEGSEPSPLSPTDNEQFGLLSSAVEATYPGTVVAPYIMMAATDSRHFHRFAPAVYRFAPLAMTAEQRAGIHGVNEFVTIDSLERGERFFQHLIRSLPAA